jgi:hypothetical protein
MTFPRSRSAYPALFAVILYSVAVRAPAEEIPAFPGAQGAGMFTRGGRGGTVAVVTNLDANGPGSLADAVSQTDRIVVFAVSGTIDLTTPNGKGGSIVISQPNLTIEGSTAPGEGICLKGGVLQISASNVLVRHLRSRRGFVRDTDSGDAIEVKPESTGETMTPPGQTAEAFEKRKAKKASRGKFIHEYAALQNIFIDHCSTSWATDENLTLTHADRTTMAYCIAAEGLDYPNSKQTPPNHSEGSLWGSDMPDGRATMHHVLYANNRLRNPRTTGGSDPPAVLTMYNCVIANWSEYPTHTGTERVYLNWLHNLYAPGLDTPAEIRSIAFAFHGDPDCRLFARGNLIREAQAATADNRLAVDYGAKLRHLTEAQRAAMIVDAPVGGELPPELQSAEDAFASVLAESGATLPARDPVDLRIVRGVREGTGRVIAKETDLPEAERWPVYHSLPAPADADRDGLPDFWEAQFGLNPQDPSDSAKLGLGGYANIEHYANNTDPRGGAHPIVWVSAPVSRAVVGKGQAGEWEIHRSGPAGEPLTVEIELAGDAVADRDFAPVATRLVLGPGQRSERIAVVPLPGAEDNRIVSIHLKPGDPSVRIGCPSASLIVIQKDHAD